MKKLFFLSILCFIVGFYNLFIYLKLAIMGSPASGRVVDYKAGLATKGEASLFPIVEFRTNDGQVISESAGLSIIESEIQQKYPIDTWVNVRYNPKKPKNFMIENDKSDLMNTFFIIGGGIACLTIYYLWTVVLSYLFNI